VIATAVAGSIVKVDSYARLPPRLVQDAPPLRARGHERLRVMVAEVTPV
jgi:hypothetical protein